MVLQKYKINVMIVFPILGPFLEIIYVDYLMTYIFKSP